MNHLLFPGQPAETEEIFLEHLRRMSPWEKLQIVMDLNRKLQLEATAEIRARYGPNVSEQELQLRLASSWLDRETMIKVYGWDPEAEPTDIDFESLRERVDQMGRDDLLRQAFEDSGITTTG